SGTVLLSARKRANRGNSPPLACQLLQRAALPMKLKRLCAMALPLIALGAVVLWTRSTKPASHRSSPGTAVAAMSAAENAPGELVELHDAVEQGLIKAEFRGNGRDKLRGLLTNAATTPLT